MTGLTAHQEARRARAEERAARLRRKAEGMLESARAETDGIPMGQPILVGHHSERRHRRALERSQQKASRAFETARAADRAESAAAGAGRSVSSDDPEALTALRAQLASLEAEREAAKACNRAYRKDPEAALAALPEELRPYALRSIRMGERPFPPYRLTNLGASIRRVAARIAELEAGPPAFDTIEGDGWRVEARPEDNRIAVVFDERQPRERTLELKRSGFRWAPSHGAWIRMLNAPGIAAARRIAESLRTTGAVS